MIKRMRRSRARRAACHLDRGAARTPVGANTLKMEKENGRERWRRENLMKQALSCHSNFSLISNILLL